MTGKENNTMIVKEFSNGKTGVQAHIKVNHQHKQRNMLDGWSNGYIGEPNGKDLLVWLEIKPDVPVIVQIPAGAVEIGSQFSGQEETRILKRKLPDYTNTFMVTVSCGGNKETFDYHMSIADADAGIVNMSDKDKIFAFYCFVQDAISGTMSFKEFKADYGYEDCCESHRIWKLCQEATIKATRLGLGDLYDLSNYLREKYPTAI